MNSTISRSSGLSPVLIALRTSFIAIIALLIISGNILSIAVTHRVTNLADSTKVLVTSLAVYDLLIGLMSVLGLVASALDSWPFGDFICKVTVASAVLFFIMSMLSIIFLNIERYIAITRPYKFPVWCSRRHSIILVLVSSTLALIFTVCSHLILTEMGITSQYFAVPALCFYNNLYPAIITFFLILAVLIPVLIMTIVYVRLIKISRDHERRIQQNGQAANNPSEHKALKTFLAVTLTLAGCRTPIFILELVEPLTSVPSPEWLQGTLMWLTFCNSILNVYIYCFFNKAFSQVAKKILFRGVTCNKSVAPINI
ncbi:beta-1 adrenergic receptor-like [Asterias amurensis]|uniref:beta-1 adrenergic receptor-like n=1 Tax=Asterias amurensis TaxID=7602 RepID=UPI003AB39DFF